MSISLFGMRWTESQQFLNTLRFTDLPVFLNVINVIPILNVINVIPILSGLESVFVYSINIHVQK